MKKKMRKFSEGGFETAEGTNASINEDTRSKAMKYVEGASEESRDLGKPTPTVAPRTAPMASKAAAPAPKPVAETPDEYKSRMEGLTKKQALEDVSPEDYVTPGGFLKGMFKKVVSMGAKNAEKAVARNIVTKTGKEIPIKQEAMNVKPPMKAGEFRNKSGEKVRVRRENDGMVDDGGSGAFKRGGTVRSSASKRADGIAIRGRTRI